MTTKAGLTVLGALFGLGLLVETADWMSSKVYFGPRARQAYAVVAGVRGGTPRGAVEEALSHAGGRLIQNRHDPHLLHLVVSYSIIEACAFTIEFADDRLVDVSSGDMNQPGTCPGER